MKRLKWSGVMPLVILVCALLGAALLVTAGGWSLAMHALWSFSFLIFVPLPLRLGLGLCILIAGFGGFVTRLRLNRGRFRWFLLPIAGLLFWFLRERTLHGDGEYKLKLLATQTLQNDPYVWKEPLDSLVAYSTTALVHSMGGSPAVAEALISVVAGLVYVAAALVVADQLAKVMGERARQKEQFAEPRAFFLIGLLALGSSQLWFGHIENYSLVTATSFAAVALSIGYLIGQAPLWSVGLMTGLAISFHPQAAFAAPALLLLLKRQQWPRQVLTLVFSGLVGPLFTVGAMRLLGAPWPDFTHGYAGNHQLFFSPAQIFTRAQLGQVWNNLWLVAPLAPLWLVAGSWALTKPALRQDARFRYLTGVAAGLLIYLCIFRNELPRHQDWDLFAIVGPAVTLWGLYAWAHLCSWSDWADKARAFKVLTAILLTFAVCFTVAWIGVNHFYTLIRPDASQRALYQRYQLLDLRDQLAQATITPNTPICADAKGCERVAALSFTMPQNGDERPVIFAHAPARVEFVLSVPVQASFLWLSPALDPAAWAWGGDGVQFQVSVKQNGGETVLWSRFFSPARPADQAWQEALVSLAAYHGQTVTLILATLPGPADNNAGDRAGWGMPWLMAGTPDTRFDKLDSSQ